MEVGLNVDLRYLKWLMGHFAEAQAIFNAVQAALAAETLKEKILAFHPVLDAIAAIVDDFPIGFGDSVTEGDNPELAAQMANEAGVAGINWDRLVEIAKLIIPIILLFVKKQN